MTCRAGGATPAASADRAEAGGTRFRSRTAAVLATVLWLFGPTMGLSAMQTAETAADGAPEHNPSPPADTDFPRKHPNQQDQTGNPEPAV